MKYDRKKEIFWKFFLEKCHYIIKIEQAAKPSHGILSMDSSP